MCGSGRFTMTSPGCSGPRFDIEEDCPDFKLRLVGSLLPGFEAQEWILPEQSLFDTMFRCLQRVPGCWRVLGRRYHRIFTECCLLGEDFEEANPTRPKARQTDGVASCQHRFKTTAFPPVLTLGEPSAGTRYVLYNSF